MAFFRRSRSRKQVGLAQTARTNKLTNVRQPQRLGHHEHVGMFVEIPPNFHLVRTRHRLADIFHQRARAQRILAVLKALTLGDFAVDFGKFRDVLLRALIGRLGVLGGSRLTEQLGFDQILLGPLAKLFLARLTAALPHVFVVAVAQALHLLHDLFLRNRNPVDCHCHSFSFAFLQAKHASMRTSRRDAPTAPSPHAPSSRSRTGPKSLEFRTGHVRASNPL